MPVTPRTRRKALYDGLTALAGLVGIPVASGAQERPAPGESAAADPDTPEHRQFEWFLRERVAAFDRSGRPTPRSAPAMPLAVVRRTARRHGWTDADVDEYIEILKREGQVYEPRLDWIATVRRRE